MSFKKGHLCPVCGKQLSNRAAKTCVLHQPPRSDVTRQKHRDAMRKRREQYGCINSPETREKLRLANLGKKATPETRLKLRISHLGNKTGYQKGHKTNVGRVHSEDFRRNMSLAQRGKKEKVSVGSNHWNWQGGKTNKNTAIRNSFEYKVWRKVVFLRDDFTCQNCGDRGGVLHVDHIKPFASYPDLRLTIENGRTLCVDCHKQTETYLNKKATL